nr:hypothetical protein 20 [bacterium]
MGTNSLELTRPMSATLPSRETYIEALRQPWRLRLPCGHHSFTKTTSNNTGRRHYVCNNCRATSETITDKLTGETFPAY